MFGDLDAAWLCSLMEDEGIEGQGCRAVWLMVGVGVYMDVAIVVEVEG
jgi:hypothetical protein